jgi:hypothetical protein
MYGASRPTVWRRLLFALREPVTVALIVALAITATLAALVLGAWSVPPSAGDDLVAVVTTPVEDLARLAAQPTAPAPTATATPRAVVADIPTPLPLDPTPTPEPTRSPRPTRTPRPEPSPTPRPTPTVGPSLVYDATGSAALRPWAEASWSMDGDLLVNPRAPVVAEQWVAGPNGLPRGDYAVVAEVRVRGLVAGVCDQSFGVVAGNDERVVWGGGLFFPCDTSTPRARLTDLTAWEDGYNRDQQLADREIDFDDGWHTVRFEVRGTDLRLLIDDEEVLTASDPRASESVTDEGRFGLWSQGVNVSVRRIAVYQL